MSLREKTGRYPETFEKTDVWGRRILYETDGRDFALVSYGADGIADRDDYRLAALVAISGKPRVCPPRNGDTIVVNGRLVQGCAE